MEQAINSAVSTTFDAANIELRATLSPDPKGERTVRLDAHIDKQDIVLFTRATCTTDICGSRSSGTSRA